MFKERLNKELVNQVQVNDSNNTSNISNLGDNGIQIIETQKTFNGNTK